MPPAQLYEGIELGLLAHDIRLALTCGHERPRHRRCRFGRKRLNDIRNRVGCSAPILHVGRSDAADQIADNAAGGHQVPMMSVERVERSLTTAEHMGRSEVSA